MRSQTPAWPQHATRLGVAGDPIGKKHRAELAANDVERGIFERQVERVRLPPFDTAIGPLPGGGIVELARLTIGHGARGVDEQEAAQVRLVFELLDEILVGAGVGLPVKVPHLITRRVLAVLRELDAGPPMRAPMLAVDQPLGELTGSMAQAPDLRQKLA